MVPSFYLYSLFCVFNMLISLHLMCWWLSTSSNDLFSNFIKNRLFSYIIYPDYGYPPHYSSQSPWPCSHLDSALFRVLISFTLKCPLVVLFAYLNYWKNRLQLGLDWDATGHCSFTSVRVQTRHWHQMKANN